MKFFYMCTLVCLACFAPALQAQAQDLKVSGTVTDTTGVLPGVNVSVKNKAIGTITNFDGKYAINVQPSDTLVFSYTGYKTLSEPVNNRTTINVQLQKDATALSEVIINAGYYNTTQRERTGSISRITAEEIEKQPVNNPLAAMQGRMPGVHIVQNSGVPGSGFDIRIRGINSLRADGNSPLYIVDGVPYSSRSLGDAQTSGLILAGIGSPLNNINPQDIKSIEVLKDADATAIYGSRGANGVVLITTKKGEPGKTKVSIHNYTGFAEVTRTMDMMNTQQYLAMRSEAFDNDGISSYPANAYDINGTWSKNRYTDWREELIGETAFFNSFQVSLSGGSALTQYLISGGHRNETSVFPGNNRYTKTTVHSKLNHRSKNERFKVDFSVNYTSHNNNIRARDLTFQAYLLPPNAPALYDDKGNLNWEDGTFSNPLAYAAGKYTNHTNSLIGNSVLSYAILPDLLIKANLGYTQTHLSESQTLPSTVYNPSFGITSANSILFLNNGSRSSWIVEPQLQWEKKWSENKFEFLLGTTFQSEKSSRLSQMGIGFSSNSLINSIGAATTVQVTADQRATYKYQAFFGRINYMFKKKYIVNLTGRRDGSSRFGPGNRFANFGAVGAAWVFSEENLFNENLKWLSFGKLRGSYGITGNDKIGDYQFLDTYSIADKSYNGITGLRPTRLFNPEFGWETNKKLELAIELGFMKNRIYFSTVWYRNRSSNQLVGIPLPATTGFPSMQANLDATVQNTGVEMEFRTENFKNENFAWTTSLNLSIPKNELLEFEGLEGSSYANTYIVGESVNILKTYHYIGIDPETGTYLFEDYDGDGIISSPSDRQFINDISPKWFGGFRNHLRYKNFEMGFFFQFVKQKGRNYLATINMPGTMMNMPVEVLNHWPQNGPGSEIQLYSTGANPDAVDAYSRYKNSNAIISDASFVRLKTLSFSYNIPEHWSKTFSGKIYVQGQNLLTLTNYKGGDPENQTLNYLPPLRRYTLGVQLNF